MGREKTVGVFAVCTGKVEQAKELWVVKRAQTVEMVINADVMTLKAAADTVMLIRRIDLLFLTTTNISAI